MRTEKGKTGGDHRGRMERKGAEEDNEDEEKESEREERGRQREKAGRERPNRKSGRGDWNLESM